MENKSYNIFTILYNIIYLCFKSDSNSAQFINWKYNLKKLHNNIYIIKHSYISQYSIETNYAKYDQSWS